MTTKTVFIASDHAGFALKVSLVAFLTEKGYSVQDLGPDTTQSCHYPLFAKALCHKVLEHSCPGILVCGTGIGMSITANRFPGIRAALCTHEFHAAATRSHNDANVLCLGERVTGPGVAQNIAALFLETPFEGGRHAERIRLIDADQ